MSLTDEEAGRLIHLRNEMVLWIAEWKKHGWGPGLAARFKAMAAVFDDEPTPSAGFANLATKKSLLTEEQCRSLVNGALLVMARRAGGRLNLPTMEIFEAYAALGTLALAISDDDSILTITGMKQQ